MQQCMLTEKQRRGQSQPPCARHEGGGRCSHVLSQRSSSPTYAHPSTGMGDLRLFPARAVRWHKMARSITDLAKSQVIYCYHLVFRHCSIPIPGTFHLFCEYDFPPHDCARQGSSFRPVHEQLRSRRWLQGMFSALPHSYRPGTLQLARTPSPDTAWVTLREGEVSMASTKLLLSPLSPREAPQVQTAASGLQETP